VPDFSNFDDLTVMGEWLETILAQGSSGAFLVSIHGA
jgi:hypothetical protein